MHVAIELFQPPIQDKSVINSVAVKNRELMTAEQKEVTKLSTFTVNSIAV